MTSREFKVEILRIFKKALPQAINKHNLLGKPYVPGTFEIELRITFTPQDRLDCLRALNELRDADYLVPTLADLVVPEDWLIITKEGLAALDRGCMDDLDFALKTIDPHLVEIREGIWAALNSKRPDSLRQAAHSARELLDQTLKTGAPDDEIREQSWFVADKTSRNGITRRMRVKLLQQKTRGTISDDDTSVFEAAAELVQALSKSLTSDAHSRKTPTADLKDSILTTEMALRRILLAT